MGINLFFSNLLEPLAQKLDEVLGQEPPDTRNIFSAPMVIVPNTNLKKWLQLYLAEKNGIIFNIDFQYLDSGLWHLLKLLNPTENKTQMLDWNVRQLLLLHILEDLKTDQTDFEPIIRYFKMPGDEPVFYDTKRLWQLSEKLAFLFQEYEFHRSEMVHGWLKEKVPENTMEICQKHIYLETKRILDKCFKSNGIHYLSLMEFSRAVFSTLDDHRVKEFKNNDVHFFSFSNISSFHLDLIKQLSRFFNFFIYSVNPCREFWEDIHTPWENRWKKQKVSPGIQKVPDEENQDQLLLQGSNSLLSLWGKAGRESIRMLCELVDYDFNTCYVLRKNNHTVLEKIQNQVLTFWDNTDLSPTAQDTSIQIIACPGRFREVETVYNSIIHNLSRDSSLRLTDIAIQVPDISDYKPWIDMVFDRHPKVITCNLADAEAQTESLYGKAILGFLELASGKFSRKEVFELLLNPCLSEKWGLSVDDIQVFAGWCQALNIFHTFDKNSKIRKGYFPSDMYTWQQGLMRLKLSRIFSDPGNALDEKSPLLSSFHRHFHEKIPYSDTTTGDMELLEKFCVIVETLHFFAGQFCKGSWPGQAWKEKFTAACNYLFAIPPEINAEKTVQKALYKALDELCIFDGVIRHEDASGMDLSSFKEFIKSRLSGIRGGYGDYLTSGVTISALLPMRPIPFRIVYVLGMQEGAFPGRAETSCLDLRINRTKAGDISLPERNRYLFLELLLSVKEKLYISYVGKDLQKDQVIQPCSVVNQLRRYIESEVFFEKRTFDIAGVPLKGSSAKYVAEKAIDDHCDIFVNYSTADRIMYYREKNLWPELVKKISEKQKETINSFCPDFSLPQPIANETEIFTEKITTRQLAGFLKNPVKQNIQKHLLLYEQEEQLEDIVIFEDEPFYSTYPEDFLLKLEPIGTWIDHLIFDSSRGLQEGQLTELFQKLYDKYRIQNQTPEGVYARLDMISVQRQLNQWSETLLPVLSKMMSAEKKPYHAMRLGETTERPSVLFEQMHTLNLCPLQIGISTVDTLNAPIHHDVQISGRLPWLWIDDAQNWHCLVLTGSGKKPDSKPDRFILEPVLNYFLARCYGPEKDPFGDVPITFHVAYQQEIRSWSCHAKQDEVLDYIQKLVSQYLNPHMRRWLPFDEVVKASGDTDNICSSQHPEGFSKSFELKLSEALAETDDPLVSLSNPEIDQYCLQTACDRFGIFFRLLHTPLKSHAVHTD
ncbi:MAG: exodeoxyribonuclease V subunit gamma [Desulfobacterales bacterium]